MPTDGARYSAHPKKTLAVSSRSAVDGLELATASSIGTRTIVAALQRDHRAELALVHGVDRGDPEAGREHAVVRGGRPAPEDVAEDRHPRLESGAALDLLAGSRC